MFIFSFIPLRVSKYYRCINTGSAKYTSYFLGVERRKHIEDTGLSDWLKKWKKDSSYDWQLMSVSKSYVFEWQEGLYEGRNRNYLVYYPVETIKTITRIKDEKEVKEYLKGLEEEATPHIYQE